MANDFTTEIDCNWFYKRNILLIILLYKCIVNDFTEEMHYKQKKDCKWWENKASITDTIRLLYIYNIKNLQ